MPDADLDQVTDALMGAAYGSAGERCMAISVAVVVGDVADKVVERLIPRVKALIVKDGMQADAEMGPLVTAQHRNKVIGYIEDGIASGADMVVDGRGLTVAGKERGFFLGGTLFDNVKPAMNIYREEIFGPVLAAQRFATEDDAVRLANDSVYGLGAGLWTSNLSRAHRLSRRLRAGLVWVNCYADGDITVPFGGVKQSGFGRDKSLHALDKYSALKTTWLSLPV
ncbi:hypothetical protein G6F57_018040 [Rhizopus arrhizus]|nr:hypothetical protein G6F57_018040 [Rhizopus arrhizus]